MVQVEAIQTMGLALRVMFYINHSIFDVIGHLRTNNNSSMTLSASFKEQKNQGFTLVRVLVQSHPDNGKIIVVIHDIKKEYFL